MHFTIPYVEEAIEEDGKKIQLYKIYINGAHHCSVRYSKFYSLNEELKMKFKSQDLPYFPPKKFLKLGQSQIDERKEHLEYYIQKIASSIRLNCTIFHNFLKSCQMETEALTSEATRLPIYFLNGQKFEIDISTTDLTRSVLEEFASFINMSRKVTAMFGLFLVRLNKPIGVGSNNNKSNGHAELNMDDLSIIRQLQDFEYPVISLREVTKMNSEYICRIVVRKKVWDLDKETEIVACGAGLDILFSQVCGEVEYGWLKPPTVKDDARANRLISLIEKRARKETLNLARTLPLYGYLRLSGECQYSLSCNGTVEDKGSVRVALGNNEVLLTHLRSDADCTDAQTVSSFPLTRIKTWRISSVNNLGYMTYDYLDQTSKCMKSVELKNDTADQIILMSMCLKSMAEEFVHARDTKGQDNSSFQYESLNDGSHRDGFPGGTGGSGSVHNNNLIIDVQRSMYFCTDINDDDL